jgi:hypothetical protein
MPSQGRPEVGPMVYGTRTPHVVGRAQRPNDGCQVVSGDRSEPELAREVVSGLLRAVDAGCVRNGFESIPRQDGCDVPSPRSVRKFDVDLVWRERQHHPARRNLAGKRRWLSAC